MNNQQEYNYQLQILIHRVVGNLKSPKGDNLTSSTDDSITTTFDVTDQVGQSDLVLSLVNTRQSTNLIRWTTCRDTGYFVNNMTSKDPNSKYFTYIPRYVAELTKVSNEKGMFVVKIVHTNN